MSDLINQECRRKAIEDFVKSSHKVYLDMVDYARKQLGIFLGHGFLKTCKAEEIMHEIFSDIIDGTRAWDMNKLALEQMLWGCIDSEVSNLAKKEKHYVSVDKPADDEAEDSNPKMDILINSKPEDVEGNIDAAVIENYCRDVILDGDEDAQLVFNDMVENFKPNMIVQDLGISKEKLEITIRKIRRRISRNIPYHLIQNLPKDLILKIKNYR